LFVSGVLLGPLWWLLRPTRLVFIGALALYATIVIGTAVIKSRFRPGLAARTTAAIVIMHLSYGLGFLRGLGNVLLRRKV
jgi:hypothetical protein